MWSIIIGHCLLFYFFLETRTWASPEAGLQDNPYSYEGYMETQGYLQMSNNTDGVAPYMNNPLYHPSTVQNEDNGLPNAFDFSDQLGKNVGGRAQLSTLFGGPMESCPKDVPPSYTALFFAASDPSTRLGQRPASSGTDDRDKDAASSASRMTSIHPIHLKVTSTAQQQLMRELQDKEHERKYALEEDEDYVDRHDPSLAPPVSLMSVESDSEKAETEEQPAKMSTDVSTVTGGETGKEKPPPYNPGYNRGYSRF